MKTIASYLFLLSIVLTFFSCHQDSNTLVTTTIVNEPQHFVENNYNGVVTDINGQPLENALVKIGDQSTTTDLNGYFLLTTLVNQNGASLKITKDGFFNGLGNLSLNQGNDNFVRIALQEKSLAAVINSKEGGNGKYEDHQVTFTPNSFTLESGVAYTGDVEVYLAYIDPTANNFSELIPGDLLVQRESPQAEILKSFGMLHVELTTPQGIPLKINEPATLEMAIPATLSSDAPSTIPLWYFDEENGLWIEEGQATKEGNMYVGTVNHFTLWNCDVPLDAIRLSGKIFSRSTLRNIKVSVSSEKLNETKTTHTNINGAFDGKVPTNDNLLIQIFNSCDEVVFSETIQTFTDDVNKEFTVNLTDIDLITLSGYVSDCTGAHIAHAYVMVNNGSANGNIIYQCDKDGYLETDFYKCTDEDITVTVVDLSNNLQSTASFSLTSNSINIGNLEACDEEIISKIVFEIDGEIETFYLVTVDVLSNDNYKFDYPVVFSDGSTYKVEHRLEFDGFILPDGWEIRSTFFDIIGSPAFAYLFRIGDNVIFIEENNDFVEVEFPIARIFDEVSNEWVTEEGRVYIKALK